MSCRLDDRAPVDHGTLVSSPISQRTTIQLYPKTIKIKKPFNGIVPESPDRSGTYIQSFSKKSQQRLRFTAINSKVPLNSQFCATYHDQWPKDGKELKKHLNTFLQAVRRKFPDTLYLWCLEFQSRGAPHFHIFTTITVTEENHRWLAETWHRIAGYGSEEHLWWHRDRIEKNGQSAFINWDMGSGAYICKYLDKEAQKFVPHGFMNVGRFWGNTRGMVPEPDQKTLDELDQYLTPEIDQDTGEVYGDHYTSKWIIRQLGRYHEKMNRRSWFRKTNRSTSVMTGTPIYRKLVDYATRNHTTEPPPF